MSIRKYRVYKLAQVSKYIDSQREDVQAILIGDIMRLQENGHALVMPHARRLDKGLLELRHSVPDGDHRIFYSFYVGNDIWLLHACPKKSTKLLKMDESVARQRQTVVLRIYKKKK